MAEFKVGCSPLTNRIYAGKVLKNKHWDKEKHDVTDTAINAVAQYLIETNLLMEFEYLGKNYQLKVEEIIPSR